MPRRGAQRRRSAIPERHARAPPTRSRASRRSPRRSRARLSRSSSARTARNGVRTHCLARSPKASARTGRRVHMHLLETIYQRAFADAPIRKASYAPFARDRPADRAPDARPLRPCARRRPRPDRTVGRDHRHQSELEPASALGHRADRRGDQTRLPRRARRRFLGARRGRRRRCAKCGSAISCMAAGASRASSRARPISRRSSPTAASPMARRAPAR